jgi:hypothetical protein
LGYHQLYELTYFGFKLDNKYVMIYTNNNSPELKSHVFDEDNVLLIINKMIENFTVRKTFELFEEIAESHMI